MAFDARGAADTINVPVLIVHSERASRPPKQELWLRSQGQIDFYDDPRLIAPATDAVAAFCELRRPTDGSTTGEH